MNFLIFKAFYPEIFFSFTILYYLIFNAYKINFRNNNFPLFILENVSQVFFILLCTWFLLNSLKIEGFLSNFLFIMDEGTRTIKILLLISSFSILVFLISAFNLQNLNFFEFFFFFFLIILSLFFLVSSYDFIIVYLIVEMQALIFYTLSSFKRNSAFSTEAGLKYFISGSFMSCILLLGISLIYGALGSLNFFYINLLLNIPLNTEYFYVEAYSLVGIILITVAFFFKISIIPFHFWSPDVYEGSPLSVTTIFSVLPKLVLFTFLVKWSATIGFLNIQLQFLMFFVAISSIFIGTFLALKQKRLKRLFIYSSIAQIGFLVLTLSINSLSSFYALYFFLIIYIITAILVWGLIIFLYSFQKKIAVFMNYNITPLFLSNLTNFFKINKIWSFSFLIALFSIAGIPPFSGFLAKFFIFFELIKNDYVIMSLIIVFISIISVFYYIRIVKLIFFESVTFKLRKLTFQTVLIDFHYGYIVLTLCMFLLFGIFFYPSFILLISQYIILNLFGLTTISA